MNNNTAKAIIDAFERHGNASGHGVAESDERAFPSSKISRWEILRSEKAPIIALSFILILLLSPKVSLARENIFETSFNFMKQTVQDFFSKEIKNKLEDIEQSALGQLKNILWQGIKSFWQGSIRAGQKVIKYLADLFLKILEKLFNQFKEKLKQGT